MSALADRLNPIVVHELRRGLRTRTFAFAFVFLLLACVVIALVAWAMVENNGRPHGVEFFLAFYFCLSVVAFFVIPYNAFRSLAKEREEQTWALLVLTNLPPHRILWGKIASFLAQAVLFGSAAGPFLLFSYLLKGIDLFTVLLVLVMTGAFQLFLTVAATAAATLAESRLWRGAVHFLVIGALAAATFTAFGTTTGVLEGSRITGNQPEVLVPVAIGLWALLSYGLLAFAIGVSRLTFFADNYAFWPRLALALQVLGTFAAMTLGTLLEHSKGWALALAVYGAVLAFVAGLLMSSEREGLSRRLRLQPGHAGRLSLLLPGAVRGHRFFLALAVFNTAASVLLLTFARSADANDYLVAVGCGAFAVLYASFPVLLGRGPMAAFLDSPGKLRAFSLFFLGFATGGPPIASLMLGMRANERLMNFFNPFVALANWADDPGAADVDLLVLSAVALVVAVLTDRLLAARDREATAAADASHAAEVLATTPGRAA